MRRAPLLRYSRRPSLLFRAAQAAKLRSDLAEARRQQGDLAVENENLRAQVAAGLLEGGNLAEELVEAQVRTPLKLWGLARSTAQPCDVFVHVAAC